MRPPVHPGAWLIWALGGGLVAMLTTNPFYLLPLCAAAYAVHSLRGLGAPGEIGFKVFFRFGLAALITRTALVLFGPLTAGSVAAAALEGLRLAVMLAVFGAFNSVTDPFGLLKLAPRRFHEPALAGALALSIAPRTITAGRRVREAQRLRGMEVSGWRALPALAVPVLATGMEEAVTLAESMDARGHGRGRRSRYRPERWTAASSVVAVVSTCAVALFLSAGAVLGEDLTIATHPLTWPQASPLLVAGALSFALAGLLPERDPR